MCVVVFIYIAVLVGTPLRVSHYTSLFSFSLLLPLPLLSLSPLSPLLHSLFFSFFLAAALAQLIAEENLILCVTHGNGPQVGMLALKDPETTLDVLGSESEGQIGYHIETELAGQLPAEVCVCICVRIIPSVFSLCIYIYVYICAPNSR